MSVADPEDLRITNLVERPDLAPALLSLDEELPRFMLEDPIAILYYADAETALPGHVLVAVDPDDPDVVVARAFSVPFAFGPDVERPVLPAGGWDAVVRWAWIDRLRGRAPTHVSALEITISSAWRGRGLSARMVQAMREHTRRLGFADLFAPVRPAWKASEPRTPMSDYAARTRDDGLPVDPWLRTHVRLGGRIVGICSRSMVIAGTLQEWRSWTGLPFDDGDEVEVPGALVPVHLDVGHDHAVYVEPNVWVHHRVGDTASAEPPAAVGPSGRAPA